MIIVPFIALLLGVALARLLSNAFSLEFLGGEAGIYISVACIAGLDSLLGGIRSGLEGKFANDVFLSGFLVNALLAFLLAWLGDQIGINLYLAALIVIGSRIFTNLSILRRLILTRLSEARKKRLLQEASSAPTA